MTIDAVHAPSMPHDGLNSPGPAGAPLLSIENLSTFFYTDDGVVRALRGVDLNVFPGEMVALVGESGCGKSVTALSVLRLIPTPPGKYESGAIRFHGKNLLALSEEEMQSIRGNDIGMIFQEPMTSLNPIFTVGDQVGETIALHRRTDARTTRERALALLRQVAIPAPESRIDQYPHELSGGMKQRVMIAMALSCEPTLLIADEPTTALDVTIQAQILELLDALRRRGGTAVLLITHNLGIVAEYADRVAVMYAGKIVEEAPVGALFEKPAHPYTRGLMNSVPRGEPGTQLQPIPGTVPNPSRLPEGCAFHPRCGDVLPICKCEIPAMAAIQDSHPDHRAACWLHHPPPASPATGA
jgi:peptide/nickel transport system ATP-binding protein/oligopeptide transport system ATP-binding protein